MDFPVGGSNLKFVLLTQYYPPEFGGAPVLLGSLAAEFKRQGHDVRVVTALPNYPTGRIFDGYRGRYFVHEIRDGIPVFRSWVYPAQSASLIPRLMNYLTFCFTSLFAFFWMGKPDVIFVDSPPMFLALTALLMARLKGAYWVMNISDLWPDAVAESGLVHSGSLLQMARWLERFLYKSADFVCTVTEGIQRILLEEKDVPRNKVLFLPIGVDTHLFQPRVADQMLLEQHNLVDKSVFVYAGTLGHAQGLSLLLDAADALRNRQDIAVVFVGDGPVKTQLKTERDDRGLSNVVFAEPVPLTEMPRWWSIARGALVTLKDQAVHQTARPSKSLPALASGVPVIFSGRGEMACILSDAEAGMVVPPEQVRPLVESILRLTDDVSLARKLGENGRRLCEREFSWQIVVHRWLADVSRRLDTSAAR
jgi:colanic acid biosynthesis glycosyl transferase WcaI